MNKDQKMLEEAYNLVCLKEGVEEDVKKKNEAAARLKGSGLKCVAFPVDLSLVDPVMSSLVKVEGGLYIILNDGRDIVLVDFGNIKVPFYKSTGLGERREWLRTNGILFLESRRGGDGLIKGVRNR